MRPSGHKTFLVHNPSDVDLLLMHNKTYAAEYVAPITTFPLSLGPRVVLSVKWTSTGRSDTDMLVGYYVGTDVLITHPQDRPRSLVEKEGRDLGKGKAVGCQGHKFEGEGHDGVVGVEEW